MAKIIDNYILLEHICQGQFGEIHKGRNLISKEAVAVKTVLLDSFLNDSILRDMIINEIQALKKLDDPHIVRMIKMLKSSNNIYLIYEFLQGRNLKKILNDRHHLTELEAIQIFKQISKGFEIIQNEKIIKKNLNSYNIHVIETSNDNPSSQQYSNNNNNNINNNVYEVKLKHFFVCKTASSNSSSKKFDSFLFDKFHYVAPELLSNSLANANANQPSNNANQQNNGIETSACDIFSAGVVLYEMLIGSLPFEKYANTKEDLIEFYQNNDISDVISEDISHLSTNIQQLLQQMIVLDQDERITWGQLFQILKTFPDPISIGNKQIQQQGASPSNSPGKMINNNGQEIDQNSGQKLQQQKSNISNNNESEDDELDGDKKGLRGGSQLNQQQKSNKKSKSNVNLINNALGNNNINNNNANNNTSNSKQKYRNNSEMTAQINLQDHAHSPPVATVNLTSNNTINNVNPNNNINNQKDNNNQINNNTQFYQSMNSKLNKENSQNNRNNIEYPNNSQVQQNSKRDLSHDPQINIRSSLQNNNIQNNTNSNEIKQNREGINKIMEEIMDKRSKIQVTLGAVNNIMDQDEWNIQQLNAISATFILLKKAYGLSEYLLMILDNPDKALHHLNLTPIQVQAWLNSQKRQIVKQHIIKENEELKYNLQKFQDDFYINIDINIHGVNVYNYNKNNNNQSNNDIDNDEILNSLLFNASKEMSSASQNSKNRKSIVLAHYLADIACIDIMYNKFLGKKRFDVLNHPYFKKLTEISRDKLYENLENKFKLYEYHRTTNVEV